VSGRGSGRSVARCRVLLCGWLLAAAVLAWAGLAGSSDLARPARADERVTTTFCGT